MNILPFGTERFFARHEFSAPHLLCCSDCETLSVGELLELAGLGPEALTGLRLGYTESQGAPGLRERIAALYPGRRAGEVVGCMPEEGIFLLMHALLEPGDRVLVLSPCYDSLANLPEHLGCRVERWPLRERAGGGWELDLGRIRELLAAPT